MIQAVVSGFLLPIMKLYMVLSLVGNLFREEMFSVMTEFLGKVVGWTVKTMFGIVVGFHLIQGLVLPQADAMKTRRSCGPSRRFRESAQGPGRCQIF